MNSQYIFVVGKFDTHANLPETVHKLGYKLGIFQDSRTKLATPEVFDQIIEIDFEHLDAEILRLKELDLHIAGLQCTYENYIVAKAKLGLSFQVPSPSLGCAKLSTDKSLMRQAFIDYDPTISPAYKTVNDLSEALDFAHSHVYPLILKPTNLVKSLLVLRCNNEDELVENFKYASATINELYQQYQIYDREPQLLLEEFITGKQCSVAAFVDHEGNPHFCDGIVSLTNAQDIGVDDNYLYNRKLPGDFSKEVTEEIFRVANAGIKALDMRSIPAHVELMYEGNTVKIIEIGARIGGYRPRMYGYSYGIDLNEQELNLALGITPQLSGTFKAYSAVYELFPTKIGNFERLSDDIDTTQFASFRVTIKQGAKIGPAKNGYKAAAIVIISEADKKVFDEQCAAIERITVVVTS